MFLRLLIPCCIVLCSIAPTALAQNGLVDLIGNAATQAAAEKGTRLRQALDSIDFQFSMSVSENAGFFDIGQKGETGSKLLYGMKSEATKTLTEKARDSLELALGQYDLRRYKMAVSTILKTQQLMENAGLTNEIVYLRVLSSLGVIYMAQGKNQEAEKIIVASLQKSESTLGKESAAYAANLNNYAKLHQSYGKYNEAEKEYEEALSLCDKVFGEGMQKAIIINNKAMLFQSIGRHADAVELMKKSMTASEGAPKKAFQGGKNSFDNRKFQANLALIYQVNGDFAKAEENFMNIQKVFEHRGQTGNPEYAGLLNQIAILYIQMGKNDKVEGLLKKSQEIYKRKFGEQNPYFPRVTNDLGNFYRMTGRYTEAEAQLKKAMSIRESYHGSKHPDFVKNQEDLAILYWKTNRFSEAYNIYVDVLNQTIEFINEYFPPMSEAEKTSYWDITAPRFQRFFNFAIEAGPSIPDLPGNLLDFHMATKALLLNSTAKVRANIMSSGNKTLMADYQKWVEQKSELVRLFSFSKKKLEQQDIDIEALKRAANAMEKSLSERSTAFSSGYSMEKVTTGDVSKGLGDDEALVDIIRVNNFEQEFTKDATYIALILKKGMSVPKLLRVGRGDSLEVKGINFYRTSIKLKQDDPLTFNLFWKKIEREIKDKKTVYVSCDGIYSQMNLNTVKPPSGEYLINVHDFINVGNPKDIIGLKAKKPVVSKRKALLLGFPDYQTDELPALPATKTEIENVSVLLRKDGYGVDVVFQRDATEKKIKDAKGLSLLHIATHGYFSNYVKGQGGSSTFGINDENALDPLLRSGLILAGAKHAVDGDEQVDLASEDNGILTAFEAMDLNLEGTSLVVLSACETALGEIKSGEGVYGLQRAFIVAGAEALVMSLWKVDDDATQALMTGFYSNWTKTGDKQKAFRDAQLQLMQKYKQPVYWGAFVMMGK